MSVDRALVDSGVASVDGGPVRSFRARRWLLRIGVVAGATVFAVYLGLWAGLIVNRGTDAADYTAFYTGWRMVADGHGAQLYDPVAQAEAQRQVLGGRSFEAGLNPFNNPPHAVLPFVPLVSLPLAVSYLAWAGVQVALLAWLAWRLAFGLARTWSTDERMLLVAASLAAPPLLITFLQGAFSLLVVVAVTELYLALQGRRDARAGLWLALGTLKPQAILTLGIALVAARRWRTLGVAAGTCLAAAAAATLVLGPGIWASYVRFLVDYVGSFDRLSVRPSVMWNLRGTLTLLARSDQSAASTGLINGLALAGQLAAIVFVGWIWRGPWDARSPRFALRFALTIVVGLLASPHLNSHDDLLLIPAAAVAYGAVRERPGGGWVGVVMLLAPFVILATNSVNANEVGGPPIRVPVVLMIAFAVWLFVTLRQADREAPDTPAVIGHEALSG